MPCTFDRPAKRRGVKPGSRASALDNQSVMDSGERVTPAPAAAGSGAEACGTSTSRSSYRPSNFGDPWSTFDHGWSAAEGNDDYMALHDSWKAFAIACDRQIKNLVQVYFEIVYPMYAKFLTFLAGCFDL